MYEHVKTGYKNIPPSEQPLQFQSEYYLNKTRMHTYQQSICELHRLHHHSIRESLWITERDVHIEKYAESHNLDDLKLRT